MGRAVGRERSPQSGEDRVWDLTLVVWAGGFDQGSCFFFRSGIFLSGSTLKLIVLRIPTKPEREKDLLTVGSKALAKTAGPAVN